MGVMGQKCKKNKKKVIHALKTPIFFLLTTTINVLCLFKLSNNKNSHKNKLVKGIIGSIN